MRSALLVAAIVAPFAIGVAVAAPSSDGETVLTFADRRINESSGLVALEDAVVTVNDSGDSARIFIVSLTGDTAAVIDYGGTAVDVEALAPAAGDDRAIWVADIGDNLARRSSLSVVRVPLGGGSGAVPGERFPVSWEVGPADAEALMVHPVTGRMYAVTKAVVGGQVLRGPEQLSAGSTNVFETIGEAPALVTDGAFFSDGEHFVLRNYGAAYVFETATLEQVGVIDLPAQDQGEGLAVTADGEIWISSEGVGTEVLRVAVPAPIASVVGSPPDPASDPAPDATESAGATSPPEGTAADPAPGPELSGEEDLEGPTVLPWVLGGLAAVLMLAVLVRSLRPR